MIKIEIDIVDTPEEKFTRPIDPIVIYLYESYLSFQMYGNIAEDGQEYFFLRNGKFDKSAISSIEIYWHQQNNQFQIVLSVHGNNDDIKIFLDDEQITRKIFKQLTDWRWTK